MMKVEESKDLFKGRMNVAIKEEDVVLGEHEVCL